MTDAELEEILTPPARSGLDGCILRCRDRHQFPAPAMAAAVHAAIEAPAHGGAAALSSELSTMAVFRRRVQCDTETSPPLQEPILSFAHRHGLQGESCRRRRDRNGIYHPECAEIERRLNRLVGFNVPHSPRLHLVESTY